MFYLAEPCQGSNLALRSWMRVRSQWERLRRREHHAGGAPVIDIPDHQEGPIDPDELLTAIYRAGLDAQPEYGSRFLGLERLPYPLYKLALRLLTRPWRHRSGNLIVVTGTKLPHS